MTHEEMILELKKAGYSVHGKLDEKILDRRRELYWLINDYFYDVGGSREHLYEGWWLSGVTDTEWYARVNARKKMKKLGYSEYNEIPDTEWPTVKEAMLNEAKRYIDKRIEKFRAGR